MRPKALRKYSSQAMGMYPGIENPNVWNPLENLKDAFNLMLHLRLNVTFYDTNVIVHFYDNKKTHRLYSNTQFYEWHGHDVDMACAEAITTVAAHYAAQIETEAT